MVVFSINWVWLVGWFGLVAWLVGAVVDSVGWVGLCWVGLDWVGLVAEND